MADQKITDLDLYSVLASGDLFVMVDLDADKTVKVPLSGLLPAGGAEGQILAKDSATDYDFTWVTKDAPLFAEFTMSNTQTYTTGDPDIINFADKGANNIPSLDLDGVTAGVFDFPAGTYVINARVMCYANGLAKMLLYNEDIATPAAIYGGEVIYANASRQHQIVAPFNRIIIIPTGGLKVSFRLYVQASHTQLDASDAASMDDLFGSLIIQKII